MAMAAQGVEADVPDCNFSNNVRKPYWRSATWNARSAPKTGLPPSSASSAATGHHSASTTENNEEKRIPVLERQTSKSRASLPPLQPLSIARRSLDEWPKAALDDMDSTDWNVPCTPGRRRIKTGPDIKIDLTSVPRGSLDVSEIQLKRDKFAFFDKECSRVSDSHIYLGSDAVAKNREMLKANGITHVLNCVGFVCPEYFRKDFVYKTLWLQDSPGEDITSLLYDVFDYFEEVKEQGGRVFVHCCQGVSRSTSLVIAYMMWRGRLSFEDAFQGVKASRGVTNPNMGFACQLLQCQKRVHAAPMSPNSVLRMYRLAPHSPYDPLHLVPKAVNNPGAGSLDSRGAYVIHVPLAIYVWIGHHCDNKIADAARVAASQVVRYERAQGPIHIVREGHESTEFWNSLGIYADPVDIVDNKNETVVTETNPTLSPLEKRKRAGQAEVDKVRKIGIGKRVVDAYSADFELFQRARQGGVVPPVPSTSLEMSPVPTRIPAREDGWSVLRKKFLSGELVTPKEQDFEDGSSLSPNPSLASSSPAFSPFSSTSSSSGNAGCDSPFASPLSQLSISSPHTPMFYSPCATIDNYPSPHTPMFYSPCATIDNYQLSPRVVANSTRFQLKINNRPPVLASTKPAILLAKRRAAAAAAEVATQSVSEMDTSTDVSDKADSNAELNTSDQVMQDTYRNDDSLNSWQTILELGVPVLYTWPGFERITAFNVNHLNSKAVVLCILPQQILEGKNILYVWIGKDFEKLSCEEDNDWTTVAQKFLEHMNCCDNLTVMMAREGNEPEDFLDGLNLSL